jgi:hypothetical protein
MHWGFLGIDSKCFERSFAKKNWDKGVRVGKFHMYLLTVSLIEGIDDLVQEFDIQRFIEI